MSHSDRIESLIEAQIKAARENGEFDNLPGAGKPIPGKGEPYDEDWWIKEYLRRENLGAEATLPPSLRLAREVEQLADRVRKMPSEQRVREAVAELNTQITAYQLRPSHPFVPVRRVDAEQMVEVWRAALAERHTQQAVPSSGDADETPTRGRGRCGWFRRRRPA